MQQQAADRVGRAAAIVHQLGEVAVTVLVDILPEGIQQVAKQLQRQVVVRDHRPQAEEYRMPGGFAAFDGVEFRLIIRQQRVAGVGREVAFIGEIVGLAGEPVDRRHRLAQSRRKQNGSDGEVFVVIHGHDAAGV